jgi:hypothetical protein
MGRLTVTSGPAAGRSIELERDVIVGRDEGADLAIPDPDISRRHAAIRPAPDGGVIVEDLGSSNGTFVDGRRIGAPVTLTSPAKLQLGDSELSLEPASAPPLRTAPPEAPAPPAAPRPGRRPPVLLIALAALVVLAGVLVVIVALGGGDEETKTRTLKAQVTSPPITASGTAPVAGVLEGEPLGKVAVFIDTRIPLTPEPGGQAIPVAGSVFVTAPDGNLAFDFSGTLAATAGGGEDLQAEGRAGNGTGDFVEVEGPVTISGGRKDSSTRTSRLTLQGKLKY